MEWQLTDLQSSTKWKERDKVENVDIIWKLKYESKEFGLNSTGNNNPVTLFLKKNATQSKYWVGIFRKKEWIHNEYIIRGEE